MTRRPSAAAATAWAAHWVDSLSREYCMRNGTGADSGGVVAAGCTSARLGAGSAGSIDYDMINGLNCRGIIIAIDRQKFLMKNPSWSIATTAWSFILEWYNMELEEKSMNVAGLQWIRIQTKYNVKQQKRLMH